MFGRTNSTEATGTCARERISRSLHAAGQVIAGDRGWRAANAVSEAIGCGRIEFCDDPNCPDCN